MPKTTTTSHVSSTPHPSVYYGKKFLLYPDGSWKILPLAKNPPQKNPLPNKTGSIHGKSTMDRSLVDAQTYVPTRLCLHVHGDLPFAMTSEVFKSNIMMAMRQDKMMGDVNYKGFTELSNLTKCYNFTGFCPVHNRVHEGTAKFQYQISPKGWAYWKCFRDNKTCKSIYLINLQ